MSHSVKTISPLANRVRPLALSLLRISPVLGVCILILAGFVLMALFAPLISHDPMAIDPMQRLAPPGLENPFGTDRLGRDVLDRTIHGARISLLVGTCVAILTVLVGLSIGLVAGMVTGLDNILMRGTDALTAIPSILLAIALMALFGSGVGNVIFAISVSEAPGMIRLVRSVVLSQRGQTYVEAAIATGTRTPKLLVRHILPNTIAPLLVQGTLVFASAIITEAILSFLGAGTPPDIPSWGNIIAEGRTIFPLAPWVILFPGLCLTIIVLAMNVLGDMLRDQLDPRLKKVAER